MPTDWTPIDQLAAHWEPTFEQQRKRHSSDPYSVEARLWNLWSAGIVTDEQIYALDERVLELRDRIAELERIVATLAATTSTT